MIADVSKWNGRIDWDKLAPELDFAILKATGGEIDPRFEENAKACLARGVSFHAYHFLYATNAQKAEEEAVRFWNTASPYRPESYIVDVEGEALNSPDVIVNTKAFISKLRALGAGKIGLYTGDWAYCHTGFSADMADYIWIARYGKNSGEPETPPNAKCDLWQYTSNGTAPGVNTKVDLSKLQGDKGMDYFAGGEKMATVIIGSAHGDENGNAHGGQPGDQTGKEVSTERWYKHSKGWRVFRAKNPEVAQRIAQDMQAACDNPCIGYDQYDRLTLHHVSEPLGFDCAVVETKCETDCSALVRVCAAYGGVDLPNFNTETEPRILLDSGAFVEMVGTKYTDQDNYLRVGDILVTRTKGHTAVVLSDGPKAYDTGLPTLRRGDKDAKNAPEDERYVEKMQKLLLAHGFSVGADGADGDFGKNTEEAVKKFQIHNNLQADGVCGPKTWAALREVDKLYTVTIKGLTKLEADTVKAKWPTAEVTEE